MSEQRLYPNLTGRKLYATPAEARRAELDGQKRRIAGFKARKLCIVCGRMRDQRPLLTCMNCLFKNRRRREQRQEKLARERMGH